MNRTETEINILGRGNPNSRCELGEPIARIGFGLIDQYEQQLAALGVSEDDVKKTGKELRVDFNGRKKTDKLAVINGRLSSIVHDVEQAVLGRQQPQHEVVPIKTRDNVVFRR